MPYNLDLKEYLTISISLLALLISFFNYWKDIKKISVSITKKEPILYVEDFDCVEMYPNQSPTIGIELRFLNPSKYNIGYFDLVFRDYYSGEFLPATFKYALRPERRLVDYLGKTIDGTSVNINLMDTNYGTIPSNSYVKHEVLVYPQSEKIRVNIKFAKRTIFYNFRSETSKFYSWKSKVIVLDTNDLAVFQKYNQANQQ